ncbi:hypothetical protein QYM36_006727 [Artemia franciscana]|uniref:Lysosomal Pro-X carboxypeptidase n=2 Tax=Artemia franciscana TaxID=6661 RepID=A0AA88L9N8_ARTSF|nr:hypothetical protein QYM36_006727 [Artemia franciscana]
MLLFAEHRYYGKSLPFGNDSYSNASTLGYLTAEQAMADFATLLTHLRRTTNGTEKSPVIAFGGSYGGMLAAWMRVKYPHIIQGAIAASAPVLQFKGVTPCSKFGRVVTKDYETQSPACANVIRKSWQAIENVTATDKGLEWLSNAWQLCKPLKSSDDKKRLKDWLSDVWTNLAMVDYPYPASFLAPLPANPVKEVCKKLKDDSLDGEELLRHLFRGLSVYTNYTQKTKCVDIRQAAEDTLGEKGWDFQACTEMVMPMCNDGKRDFFEPMKWNFSSYTEDCHKKFGVKPRLHWAEIEFGGKKLEASSNIVFSNGLLDPWSSGGVMSSISAKLPAVIIPEGAHHLDLRASDPADPPSVIKARKLEKYYIRTWIKMMKH